MVRTHLAAAIAASAFALAVVACSSSSSSGGSSGSSSDGGASDTGTSSSGGDGGGGKDAGADAADNVVNACRTFEDHTAAGDTRAVPWDFTIATSPARCMKIKVGQSVTWTGDFTTHPLTASGGDKPNPIAGADQSKATSTVAFPAAGTYGYADPSVPAMLGAVEVIP